jgi:hypothetical protein
MLDPAFFVLTLAMVLLMAWILLRRRKDTRPMTVISAGLLLATYGLVLVQTLFRLIGHLMDGPDRRTFWLAMISLNLALTTAGAWWYFRFIQRAARSRKVGEDGESG